MLEKKSNWEIADKLISKDRCLSQSTDTRAPISGQGKFIESPNGLVSKIQSGQVKDQSRPEFDRVQYENQLLVYKQQLKEAIEKRIKEMDADIENVLTDIIRQQLRYLT